MAVNNYKKILDLYSDSASNEEVVNKLPVSLDTPLIK